MRGSPSAHRQPNYDMDNDSAQNSALPQWTKVLEITLNKTKSTPRLKTINTHLHMVV